MTNYPKIDLRARYGMSVEIARPIQKHSPKVSFVYRHQIHCWITVDSSKARRRGIIVVAANYIPDICTEEKLFIREYPVLHIMRNDWEGSIVEGDGSSGLPKSTFSFGTAIASEGPTQVPRRFQSFMHRVMPKVQNPQEKTGQGIIIHTHVHRGWDHTNLRWQKVVWPELDCDLQPLQGRSTAAWRLDWRGQGAENAEDPSSAEIDAESESSIMDEEPATDLELAVKPVKGKAREVA
ncbi:hypothetical protein PILCRDRAFT_820275 [Piloderma croceum F 1598]|uniref:Uncharacterized protein n=1 Tax=Piloderma croceum (strain F 1598) TaxID=765440 RepID=A0A0C3B800_PILCF|nr:hypothetical protein PILCRDRAFT_820275 [Piloderma croceum F 1598]